MPVVFTSEDGLHFGAMQEWLWDDATPLGTYNTQSHWVTHHDALYLCYTRRGANNDHVFRYRAPLFIAEVDPATLRVKRATEQVLLPERGARYGNFGVCDFNENETWVIDTEWMQRPPEEKVIPVEINGAPQAGCREEAGRVRRREDRRPPRRHRTGQALGEEGPLSRAGGRLTSVWARGRASRCQ